MTPLQEFQEVCEEMEQLGADRTEDDSEEDEDYYRQTYQSLWHRRRACTFRIEDNVLTALRDQYQSLASLSRCRPSTSGVSEQALDMVKIEGLMLRRACELLDQSADPSEPYQ